MTKDATEKAQHWQLAPILGVDLETTGLDPERDQIIEWGWAELGGGRLLASGGSLVRCVHRLSPRVLELTGIDEAELQKAPTIDALLGEIEARLAAASLVVAYNAAFDRTFLARAFLRAGRPLPQTPWVDPFVLVRDLERDGLPLKLSAVCARWGIRIERPHRAPDDALAAVELMLRAGDHLQATTADEVVRALEDILRSRA